MNREQFAAATARLDEAELRKALWTLYWRGTATVRERIEELITPGSEQVLRRATPAAPDPDQVLEAVQEFTVLVRSGAYLIGNRAVRPKERSQWRFTFRRLLADARAALAADDPADAEAALTELIDLSCQLSSYEYVRSQDPIEAAAVVVSDEVAMLWRHLLERHGFAAFAARAPEQFLRWERRYGWTRTGGGKIADRETHLTNVLAGLLTVPDTWLTFATAYLRALDDRGTPPPPPASGRAASYAADERRRADKTRAVQRAQTMIDWHLLLLDRFGGSPDEALLDRLAGHPALGGPEQEYFRARLAYSREDLPAARRLIYQALETLPGHQDFLDFAEDIDATLPANAAQVVASRRPFMP
jgi:hypothetical protein